MRVILTGGTGFIGCRLAARLVARGHDPVVFTRDASRSHDALHPKARVVSWADGAPEWESLVDGAGGIVNLAGETIAQRWTSGSKERIGRSRTAAVERLLGAIGKAKAKPGVVVNASAVGYYGPHGDEELSEESPAGSDFLARTCVAWEEAARRFEALGIRTVRTRIGIVLGPEGGVLAKLLPLFRLGGGGPVGSGSQWMSWIHVEDLVDLFVWALETPEVTGVLNATAPRPVTNREFGKALGRALHRPAFAPAPALALKLALGEMSTLVLDGQRVLPRRALSLGFTFRHPELEGALGDLVGS